MESARFTTESTVGSTDDKLTEHDDLTESLVYASVIAALEMTFGREMIEEIEFQLNRNGTSFKQMWREPEKLTDTLGGILGKDGASIILKEIVNRAAAICDISIDISMFANIDLRKYLGEIKNQSTVFKFL